MKKILLVFCTLLVTSCVSLNKNEGRYVGTVADDNSLGMKVRDALFKEKHEYAVDVNVTVFNYRIMLVGAVKTNFDKQTVLAKAHSIPGAKEVISYLEIKGQESGATGFDTGIHALIFSKMLAEPGIASNNFKFVVFNKMVYVIGEAKDRQEMNLVLKTIKETPGVMGVKNNIIVK